MEVMYESSKCWWFHWFNEKMDKYEEKKTLTACYKQTMQEIEQEKAVVAHLYDTPLIGVKLIDDGKKLRG